MQDRRSKNDIFTYIGAVYMLLVIWVHAENLYLVPADKASGALYELAAWVEGLMSDKLGQIAVPGFFFISGYLFARSFGGRRIGLYQIRDKWMRRLRSLVLPYVIWNLIYYAVYIVFGRAELSLPSLVHAVVGHGWNPVFWYMQQLIILSVIGPFFYAVLSEKGSRQALFILFLIFVIAANHASLSFHLVNEDALFYYCCGMTAVTFFRDIFEGRGQLIHRRLLMGSGICYVLMGFLSGRPDILGSVSLLTGAMVLCRISGALAVWSLLCVLRAGEEPPRPWMHISFFVYATHYLVIRAIGFLLPGDVSLLLMAYLLMPAICTGAAYAGYRLMDRYVPMLYRILSGGR